MVIARDVAGGDALVHRFLGLAQHETE
jgi:hypothetical protein